MSFLKINWKVIDILAKISTIIMLLFLCYKNLTFQDEIDRLYINLTQIQEDFINALPEPNSEILPQELPPAMYKVYVTGAVNETGLYDIEQGKRIYDLIELAGGAAENANLEIINLAAYVEDARHVKIPFLDANETISVEVFADDIYSNQTQTAPININTASSDALMRLPGIGQTIANSIIEYRQQYGNFNSKEEIKNVPRIGDSLFENIKDSITY